MAEAVAALEVVIVPILGVRMHSVGLRGTFIVCAIYNNVGIYPQTFVV